MKMDMTYEEWKAEAIRRFGDDPFSWKFKCPSCGHVASVKEYKDAGAKESQAGFSCIGRFMPGVGDKNTFKEAGGPCNYAGGGLFITINPIKVTRDDKVMMVFEFAEGVEAHNDAA